GLSKGVVIIEAGKKSGALITSDFAMDFNRAVFAVPGPITSPLSFGPHQLIEQGAKLIQTSKDILEELGTAITQASEHKSNIQLSPAENLVLKYMQIDNMDFEEISTKTRLSINQIQATLSSLELKGLISQVSPQTYQKI
ncbi:MAG TPA: DNA-processing protein DprA, partial [Candidatus Doudnabacteria bacterium]|nr:DNA-processing protein DprA [Candidatus Doudnabacteria bacterium]